MLPFKHVMIVKHAERAWICLLILVAIFGPKKLYWAVGGMTLLNRLDHQTAYL